MSLTFQRHTRGTRDMTRCISCHSRLTMCSADVHAAGTCLTCQCTHEQQCFGTGCWIPRSWLGSCCRAPLAAGAPRNRSCLVGLVTVDRPRGVQQAEHVVQQALHRRCRAALGLQAHALQQQQQALHPFLTLSHPVEAGNNAHYQRARLLSASAAHCLRMSCT